MQTYLAWLKKEPVSFRDALLLAVLSGFVTWTFAAVYVLGEAVLYPDPLLAPAKIRSPDAFFAVVMVVLIPPIEELLFRGILYPCARYIPNDRVLIAAILCSSMVFGYEHGGMRGVPLQGIMGMIFASVFMKCGGMHRRPLRALMASICAHAFHNALGVITLTTVAYLLQ